MILKKITLEEVIKDVISKDKIYNPEDIKEENSLYKAIQEC